MKRAMYMIKHLLLVSSTKELIKESFWLYALVITFYLLFFVAIGSFLNVLIYRLPKKCQLLRNHPIVHFVVTK